MLRSKYVMSCVVLAGFAAELECSKTNTEMRPKTRILYLLLPDSHLPEPFSEVS